MTQILALRRSPRRAITVLALLLSVVMLATACGSDSPEETAPTTTAQAADETGAETIEVGANDIVGDTIDGQEAVALITVAEGFRGPVDMDFEPGTGRMFVTEVRSGQIRIVEDGVIADEPFLDVKELLDARGEGAERGRGERGLLSFAFHPDYETNGRFFIWLADNSGVAQLHEYTVSDDPNVADASSMVVLREYEEATDHFGGSLQFDSVGNLWFGLGDGGVRQNAQRNTHPRGGINRLDVSTPGDAVPAEGNPFIDVEDGAGDLWAIGLRNPWRWSLDEEGGNIYIGDVGRFIAEEIHVQPLADGGLNYGWPILEGTTCFRLEIEDEIPTDCDTSGLLQPDVEMLHDDVCSVMGGQVYRGSAIPDLVGTYFYADYCNTWLRSFVYEDGAVTNEQQQFDGLTTVVGFSEDTDGELYIITGDGFIRKLVPAA